MSPEAAPRRRWGRLLRESFLAGLLVLAPLGLTIYILWFVFDHVDAPLGDEINELLRDSLGLDYHIPGLGILATVAIVLAIGALTRLALFRWFFRSVEILINRVPIVRSLYSATRQIVVPFTEKDVLPFSDVVMVEYPMVGRYTLGMISRQKVSPDPDDDRVVVFFPSNHLHLGYPVILSRRQVVPIEMTVEDAIKFFVSCGVIGENEMFAVRTGPPRATVPPPASRIRTDSVR